MVSVLIPGYNVQNYLAHLVLPALARTCRRKGMIIVDDGSRDGTLSLAKRFESRSVRVVTHQNQSAATARNSAFAQCQGTQTKWLDGDNLLSADKSDWEMRLVQQQTAYRTLRSHG